MELRRRFGHVTDRQGNVLILTVLWIGVLMATAYAVAALGSGLIAKVRLQAAMTAAANTLESSMRYTGPTRLTALQYQSLVQRDFGSEAQFVLARFFIRRGGPQGWQISADGYVRWSESPLTGTPNTVVVAARVGP